MVIETQIRNCLRFPEAEPEDARQSLRRLNDHAVRDGWKRALEEHHGMDSATLRYVTDPARSRFVELLPLSLDETILEVGSSLGQITAVLAGRTGFVHGLETVPGQAEFAAERCRQEGHSNVALTCGGDDCRLPYEDALFDGVVINLVLEWCAQRDLSITFLEAQQRLLRESCRVLKAGGWFFLATKNRFGLNYLIGKRDEHTYQWRFGQALPRWLVALILRCSGKSRPGGLLHSYNVLSRLLTDAGFADLQSFWAVPEYRFPREFIPTDTESIRSARRRTDFVQGSGRSTQMLMSFVPAPLVKHVTPGLLFLARKRSRSNDVE